MRNKMKNLTPFLATIYLPARKMEIQTPIDSAFQPPEMLSC
jgi:hypothetical protein